MKIACISLGCPKNQVDLDVMVHILLSAGHETVADLAEADVILVNTCGFIESAKTEAIENILEACAYKQQNPNLKVIVTGWLPTAGRSSPISKACARAWKRSWAGLGSSNPPTPVPVWASPKSTAARS